MKSVAIVVVALGLFFAMAAPSLAHGRAGISPSRVCWPVLLRRIFSRGSCYRPRLWLCDVSVCRSRAVYPPVVPGRSIATTVFPA